MSFAAEVKKELTGLRGSPRARQSRTSGAYYG
jgi:hypothetical protein